MIHCAIRQTIFIGLVASLPFVSAVNAQPAAEEGTIESTAGADSIRNLNPQTPAERAEELDRLFADLVELDEADAAEPVAAQIRRLWARSGSDSMDLLLNRGREAMSAEDYDRARAHLSALTRLAPDFAEGWNAVATLNFIEEKYGTAVAQIERVLAIEPRHFSALSGLALILERTDQPIAAMKAWRRVNELYPGLKNAQDAIDRLSPDVDGKAI